jgi:hypothetical protein
MAFFLPRDGAADLFVDALLTSVWEDNNKAFPLILKAGMNSVSFIKHLKTQSRKNHFANLYHTLNLLILIGESSMKWNE